MKANNKFKDSIKSGLNTLILICGNLKSTEKGLVVVDSLTLQIGKWMVDYAASINLNLYLEEIPRAPIHGIEPPPDVGKRFVEFDLVIGLTTMSMAHTQARLMASKWGTRYLSLPDYNVEVLRSAALQFDFRVLSPLCFALVERLTQAQELRLKSSLGSDLKCKLTVAQEILAPGWCYSSGVLASPPDAETNIAPIEDSSEGILIADGSIPCDRIGILTEPIKLIINKGKVVGIEGSQCTNA